MGLLAAVRPDGQIALFESLMLFGGLVLALVVGLVVVIYLRRRLKAERADAAGALTLEELRRWRDAGRITVQEFETLRRQAVERLTEGVERKTAR